MNFHFRRIKTGLDKLSTLEKTACLAASRQERERHGLIVELLESIHDEEEAWRFIMANGRKELNFGPGMSESEYNAEVEQTIINQIASGDDRIRDDPHFRMTAEELEEVQAHIQARRQDWRWN